MQKDPTSIQDIIDQLTSKVDHFDGIMTVAFGKNGQVHLNSFGINFNGMHLAHFIVGQLRDAQFTKENATNPIPSKPKGN